MPGRCAPSGQRDCRGRHRQRSSARQRTASAPPRSPAEGPPSSAPGRTPPPHGLRRPPQHGIPPPPPGRAEGEEKARGATSLPAAVREREGPSLRSASPSPPLSGLRPSPQGRVTVAARAGIAGPGHRAPPGLSWGQRGPAEGSGRIGELSNHQPHEVQQGQVLNFAPGTRQPWLYIQTGGRDAGKQLCGEESGGSGRWQVEREPNSVPGSQEGQPCPGVHQAQHCQTA
ncbi:uncharacterized protein [Patagioenas fasciata]|uniref:uncharacterized protein isoform X2 n=1 Tax=Patagioenas fasciata TaxID=372321 RepID=UPI003A998DFB